VGAQTWTVETLHFIRVCASHSSRRLGAVWWYGTPPQVYCSKWKMYFQSEQAGRFLWFGLRGPEIIYFISGSNLPSLSGSGSGSGSDPKTRSR
jgi:hypothetical protein